MNSLSDRISVDYTDTYLDWNWFRDDNGKYILRVVINTPAESDSDISQETAEKSAEELPRLSVTVTAGL